MFRDEMIREQLTIVNARLLLMDKDMQLELIGNKSGIVRYWQLVDNKGNTISAVCGSREMARLLSTIYTVLAYTDAEIQLINNSIWNMIHNGLITDREAKQ